MTPYPIAIIGAGPAGLYIADQLMCRTEPFHIDIIDRHAAPIGVARYSERPVPNPRSQCYVVGNVKIERDLVPAELRTSYSAVIDTAHISTQFEADFALSVAWSQAVRNPKPAVNLHERLARRGVAATRWLNPLGLPTGRSLAEWQQAIGAARGVPTCV